MLNQIIRDILDIYIQQIYSNYELQDECNSDYIIDFIYNNNKYWGDNIENQDLTKIIKSYNIDINNNYYRQLLFELFNWDLNGYFYEVDTIDEVLANEDYQLHFKEDEHLYTDYIDNINRYFYTNILNYKYGDNYNKNIIEFIREIIDNLNNPPILK